LRLGTMSHKTDSSHRIAFLLAVLALFLIVFGFSVFFGFEKAQGLFLRLSPDRLLVPQSLLVLRSSFLSLGLLGICLILFLLLRKGPLSGGLKRLEETEEVRFLLLFLGLGFVLRMLWITFVPTQLYQDWKWYDDAAYHLSQVWRYEENGVPTAYWPIGYPLFLAVIYRIFGHSYFAVELVNVLLSLGICVLTYLVAKRLVAVVPARVSLVILTLFPSQIFFTSVLASEILFTVLLLLTVYLVLKPRDHASIYAPLSTGILLGFLILIRAVALFLPVIIVFLYFSSKRKPALILREAILTILMTFLTVSPWLLRNKLVLNSFTIATSGGINLYIGNSPISSGGWVWQRENPFKDLSAPNEVENNRLGYKLAAKYIVDDPLRFVSRGIKKEIFLFATDFAAIAKELDLAAKANRVDRFVILNIIAQTYYLTVLVLSGGGLFLVLRRGKRSPGFSLLCGVLVYWLAIHFVFFGIDRFHFPLIPMLSIFASLLVVSQVRPSSQLYSRDGLDSLGAGCAG
jgi:4-amino-4-deoxy-L-arabinose transferase-like glycosyltransferase